MMRGGQLSWSGWRVIRLWNSEVLANPDGVVRHILQTAAECLGGTHQHQVNSASLCSGLAGQGRPDAPLPSREGRARPGCQGLAERL